VSKSVLVTGGAGFIGSHLCDRLVAEGHRVICIDNFVSGTRRNILQLLPLRNFELIEHDVTIPVDVDADEIFNLACPASPFHYQRYPIETAKTAVLGAINMLDLARRRGSKIFQASTSEVYGDPAMHPQQETYWGNVNPIGLRSCYDEGKRCAETLFFDYRREHHLPIKVARIFNTYGPRMQPDDGRVVSNFITQALRGEPITLYGGGRQTRSFCYVDDLIEGCLRFMATPAEVTGPVNLGSQHEIAIGDLAERIIALTGSRSPIAMRPLPVDDPMQRRPDLSRARELLGWEPVVPLDEGLRRTIAYFEAELSGPVPRQAPVPAEL
jgi:UDP-glucuronate decarboxylase